jgi:anti-sigma B factor antagonist
MSTQPRRRRIEAEHIGDVTVISFVEKKILDEQSIQTIGEQLNSMVEEENSQRNCKKFLLNFGNVEYLSSAALGKLIALNKKVKGLSGRLMLCNIHPDIREVFEITRLSTFITIQEDEQAALQAF